MVWCGHWGAGWGRAGRDWRDHTAHGQMEESVPAEEGHNKHQRVRGKGPVQSSGAQEDRTLPGGS